MEFRVPAKRKALVVAATGAVLVGASWLVKSSWQRTRSASQAPAFPAPTRQQQEPLPVSTGAAAQQAEDVDVPRAPASLRAELRAIEAEIAATRHQIALLQSDERDAVARHDRPALESAWAEHDRHLGRQRGLEIRREQASRDLARQLSLDIDRWQELLIQWDAPAPALSEIAARLTALSEQCRARTSSAET